MCNIFSSLPPLAPLIKYKFEWIRHTREASKIENYLSLYCCKSIYAAAHLHLCSLPIRAGTWLWSNPASGTHCEAVWLTTPQSPQGPSRGLHGSLLSFPLLSTSHIAHRGFFSIQSHSVISLSLHLVDNFQQRLWTRSKGKYLHDCCPCLGSQLIPWILTYATVSGTGWDGKNIGSDRKLWLKTALK